MSMYTGTLAVRLKAEHTKALDNLKKQAEASGLSIETKSDIFDYLIQQALLPPETVIQPAETPEGFTLVNNEELEALRKKVTDYENRDIETSLQDFESLKTDLDEISQENTRLNTDVETLNAEVSDLQNRLKLAEEDYSELRKNQEGAIIIRSDDPNNQLLFAVLKQRKEPDGARFIARIMKLIMLPQHNRLISPQEQLVADFYREQLKPKP